MVGGAQASPSPLGSGIREQTDSLDGHRYLYSVAVARKKWTRRPPSLKLWRASRGVRLHERAWSRSGSYHTRLLKRLGMYAEDLSRRDLAKVAQYEVLGNDAKRQVRPVRDDRNVRLLVSNAAQRVPALVDRPVRDG